MVTLHRSADQPQYGFTVAFHDNRTYGVTINSGYYMSPGSIYKVRALELGLTHNALILKRTVIG
jgi:hypothetical protein